MKAVFRTDASDRIGTGHVIRCRMLAQTLREKGTDVAFICAEHMGHLAEMLRADGFSTSLLPRAASYTSKDLYAAWLGASESEDAAQTIAALKGQKPDWLIVDHYGIGQVWEEVLKPHSQRIFAIDDIARTHAADVLLDQNYSADHVRYNDRLPPKSLQLMGPRFALLNAAYAAKHPAGRLQPESIARVVVFFGGVDADNMTGMAVEALSQPQFAHIHADVVIGVSNPNRKSIEAACAARPNTMAHSNLPSLIDLFARADLAIGAGGGAMWERMCLGTPSLVVTIADNQVPASSDLNAHHLIAYVGHHTNITSADMAAALMQLDQDRDRRQALADKGAALVDGLGALRVAEVIAPTPTANLTVRRAVREDAAFYFALVNDPDVRKQSFNTGEIAWEGHCQWFGKKCGDPNAALFVLQAGNLPVGQIRFDTVDGAAYIDYAVESFARGRGWGAKIVELGTQAMVQLGAREIRAEVKPDNVASAAVFKKLGFTQAPSANDEKLLYVLKPS